MTKGDVPAMIRAHLKPGQTGVDVGCAGGHLAKVMRVCVGPMGGVLARAVKKDDAHINWLCRR